MITSSLRWHSRISSAPAVRGKRNALFRVAASLAAACLLAIGNFGVASAQVSEPNVNLTPEQVIRIIVGSLKDNDSANDQGIATVFKFASPANKLSTGPLPRFTTMIKRGFADMLNHSSSRYGAITVKGDTAIQAVWLTTFSGREVGYAFQLSLQSDSDHAGMWMTDMVIPLGLGPQSGTRI